MGSAPSGTTTGLGGGLFGATTSTGTAGNGLGGGLFGSTSTAASTAGASIFSTQPVKSTTLGLGGVDLSTGLKSGK